MYNFSRKTSSQNISFIPDRTHESKGGDTHAYRRYYEP